MPKIKQTLKKIKRYVGNYIRDPQGLEKAIDARLKEEEMVREEMNKGYRKQVVEDTYKRIYGKEPMNDYERLMKRSK